MKPQRTRPRCFSSVPPHKQQGVMLLEALIAVLIFIIGLLGLASLQAAMLKNASDANYRAIAGYVAQKQLANIWVTTENNRSTLPEQNTDISAASGLPGGLRTTIRGSTLPQYGCNGALDCYVVIVNWTPPGNSTQHNYTIVATID